jgi:dipeptidyl aminopeptidase/acylaminoacyl peptidase
VLAGWGGAPFAAVRTVLKASPRDPRISAMSPRSHATEVQAPILLMWKSEDTALAPEQSEAMADALARAHKPHETLVLTDTEGRAGGSESVLRAIDAFLAKNLPVSTPH